MAATLIEILTILMQYLKQDFKAAEVAYRIHKVEGNKTIFLPILSTTGLTNLRMVTFVSNLIMMDTSFECLTILRHYFKLGHKTTEATHPKFRISMGII